MRELTDADVAQPEPDDIADVVLRTKGRIHA